MDGLMPLSFTLSEPSARLLGRQLAEGLAPSVTALGQQLTQIAVALDQLVTNLEGVTALSEVYSEVGHIRDIGLQVYEINPVLLGYLQDTKNAVADLAYNETPELLRIVGCLHSLLHSMNRHLEVIELDLNRLVDCLCSGAVLHIDGIIRFGLEAGTLDSIAAFVERVVKALDALNWVTLALLPNLTAFLSVIVELVKALGGYDWGQLAKIGVGLAAIAGFVAGLVVALDLLSPVTLFLLPRFTELVKTLSELAEMLAKLSLGSFLQATGGLVVLGTFVGGVALAIKELGVELLKALDHLTEFIKGLGDLVQKLDKIKHQFEVLVLLGGLALFVAKISDSLKDLNPELLKSLQPLSDFIRGLGDLAVRLDGLSHVDSVVKVLYALRDLVGAVGAMLHGLTPQVLELVPHLTEFVDALRKLVDQIASYTLNRTRDSIVDVLNALGSLVGAIGTALKGLSTDVLSLLPNVTDFVKALTSLVDVIGKYTSSWSVGAEYKGIGGKIGKDSKLAEGIGALTAFVKQLGDTLGQLSVQVLQLLPNLTALIDALTQMVTTINGVDPAKLRSVLDALLDFVTKLGEALGGFSDRVLEAMSSLSRLVNGLVELAQLSDLDMLGAIAYVGLLGLAFEEAAAPALAFAEALRKICDASSCLSEMLNPERVASNVEQPDIEGLLQDLLDSETGAFLHIKPFAIVKQLFEQTALAPGQAGPVDQSVNLQGGITVNINAERLEANSAQLLSDEIVQRLQQRLASLRSEQDFRVGVRAKAEG